MIQKTSMKLHQKQTKPTDDLIELFQRNRYEPKSLNKKTDLIGFWFRKMSRIDYLCSCFRNINNAITYLLRPNASHSRVEIKFHTSSFDTVDSSRSSQPDRTDECAPKVLNYSRSWFVCHPSAIWQVIVFETNSTERTFNEIFSKHSLTDPSSEWRTRLVWHNWKPFGSPWSGR